METYSAHTLANSVAVRMDAGDQLVNQMARAERKNKGPIVFSGLMRVFWTWVNKTWRGQRRERGDKQEAGLLCELGASLDRLYLPSHSTTHLSYFPSSVYISTMHPLM